jgi:hypothetical protein
MAVERRRSTWPTLRLVAVPLQREPVSGAKRLLYAVGPFVTIMEVGAEGPRLKRGANGAARLHSSTGAISANGTDDGFGPRPGMQFVF